MTTQTPAYPVNTRHASFQEAIAAGKYDYVNPNITAELFRIPDGEIIVHTDIVLFHPNRDIESEDVLTEMEQLGLRPATLTELLAFGETYPETQREFPIICLGSSWVDSVGDRRVPYLGHGDDERVLDIDWVEGKWAGHCRFAAVRKS